MPQRITADDVADENFRFEDDYDDDEGEDLYFEVRANKVVPVTNSKPNTQQQPTAPKSMQPQQAQAMDSKVLSRIHLDDFEVKGSGGGSSGGAAMNKRVINDLQEAVDRGAHRAGVTKKTHGHDRSERATVESVLDPRTRLLLYKLVNTGLLSEINGCVSTGKEAHVYYAKRGEGLGDAAVKVYNTSVLIFKDREKYVEGNYRFQRYCKSNPRKMVRTWAEKEARNLARLHNGGVLVPQVVLLRQHILVMEFLGEDGWPSPKLKDVKFAQSSLLEECYLDLVSMTRRMYRTCRLVHGDLSEYNLLYHKGRVVIIDVSQSVEHDHPEALVFLRRDVVNVTRFFRAKGIAANILNLEQLFFLITAENDAIENVEFKEGVNDALVPKPTRVSSTTSLDEDRRMSAKYIATLVAKRHSEDDGGEEAYQAEEARFLEMKKLDEKGTAIHALGQNLPEEPEDSSDDGSSDESDEEEEDEDSDGDYADPSSLNKSGPTLAEMTKEERKEHQRRVKEEKRLKRSEKVPKHKKKRACKQHKKK